MDSGSESELSLSSQQTALLNAKLDATFVPHLAPLLQPKGGADDTVKNRSRALAALVISALCEVSPDEASASVVDDYDDYGIDAMHYHASTTTLYLVQAKLKSGSQFTQTEANAFCQGVRKLIRQDFAGFNEHVLRRQTAIEDAVENCSRIELVIVHVGAGMSAHADGALKQLIAEEKNDEERLCSDYSELGADRVAIYLHDSGADARVDGTVHLKASSYRDEGRKTYIGFVALDRLVTLHKQFGKALYTKNIRQHLGHKTDVNAAIRQTLADRPREFEHLNNGVTILAERIDPKNNNAHRGKRLDLTGLSIINGAQTVASAAGFVEDQPNASIADAYVPITVIQADLDHDFSKRVTRARNHQNPVYSQNFAALDDEQERLRRELALLGVHYAYKPEALGDAADYNRVRIEEAAQALAVVTRDPRFVVYLKKEPGQLLLVEGPSYKSLFTPSLTAFRLLNAVRFFRYVQAQMRIQEKAAAGTGYERLTYKHGDYAIGFVLGKRIESTLAGATAVDPARLSGALSQPFDEARQALWNAVSARLQQADKGPLAIVRNVGEALPVLREAMINHYNLHSDPALPHVSIAVPGELYPVKLYDYLASKAPQIGGLT
ncbi:hypothetical protein JCM16408A_18500 [Methylobacterium phyllosphaerae]